MIALEFRGSKRASAHVRKKKLPIDSSVHYKSAVHGFMTDEHARKMKLHMEWWKPNDITVLTFLIEAELPMLE